MTTNQASEPDTQHMSLLAHAGTDELVRDLELIHDRLFARALKLEGATDRARDLVQDTYERALARIGAFDQASNLEHWMGRIMYNLFISRCRNRARSRALHDVDVEGLAAPSQEPVEAWRRVSGDELEVALHQLTPRFRVVADLHWIECLPYKEIGERLGISPQTVGTRLYRARSRLKTLLGSVPEGDGCESDPPKAAGQ